MSYVHMRDGSVFHFPKLAGPDRPIEIPPASDLMRVAADARPSSLPLFVKSLVRGAAKHERKPRYAGVNAARLFLARACIDRMLAEGDGG